MSTAVESVAVMNRVLQLSNCKTQKAKDPSAQDSSDIWHTSDRCIYKLIYMCKMYGIPKMVSCRNWKIIFSKTEGNVINI